MTGDRGPVDGATYGAPRGRPKAGASKKPSTLVAVDGGRAADLPIPADLGPEGRQVWHEVASALPILHAELDRAALHRLARLHDERAAFARVLAAGVVLSEPIVTPTGAIVGKRVVLNPAEAALRRLDRVIGELSAALGLNPASRARLGLQSAQIDRHRAEAEAILNATRAGGPR